MDGLRNLAQRIFAVARVGLLIGVIASAMILLFSGSRLPVVIAPQVANYFLVLIVATPISLLYAVYMEWQVNSIDIFTARLEAYATLLMMGFLGGILGSLLFIALVTNILSIFGPMDIQVLSPALLDAIGVGNIAIVTLTTSVTGLALAIWYQRQHHTLNQAK